MSDRREFLKALATGTAATFVVPLGWSEEAAIAALHSEARIMSYVPPLTEEQLRAIFDALHGAGVTPKTMWLSPHGMAEFFDIGGSDRRYVQWYGDADDRDSREGDLLFAYDKDVTTMRRDKSLPPGVVRIE